MSNIKGTVTTLRQFLFNVESEVKTEVNGIKYPIIYFKKDRILSKRNPLAKRNFVLADE